MGMCVLGLESCFGAMSHSNPVRHITTLSLNKSVVIFGLLPSEQTGTAINKRAFGRGEAVVVHMQRTKNPSVSEVTANIM